MTLYTPFNSSNIYRLRLIRKSVCEEQNSLRHWLAKAAALYNMDTLYYGLQISLT